MHQSKVALTRRALLDGELAFAARSVLAGGQFGGVTPTPPPPDSRYPLPPTWETELKEIAPGVYAYIQAGGRDATMRASRTPASLLVRMACW